MTWPYDNLREIMNNVTSYLVSFHSLWISLWKLSCLKWSLFVPSGRSSWRKIKSLSKLPPTKLDVVEEEALVCKERKNIEWIMASSGCLQPPFVTRRRRLISIMFNGGSLKQIQCKKTNHVNAVCIELFWERSDNSL